MTPVACFRDFQFHLGYESMRDDVPAQLGGGRGVRADNQERRYEWGIPSRILAAAGPVLLFMPASFRALAAPRPGSGPAPQAPSQPKTAPPKTSPPKPGSAKNQPTKPRTPAKPGKRPARS